MNTILSQVGGASYDRIEPAPSTGGSGGVDIDITETEDTVDVGADGSESGLGTYGPQQFQDRFRFEIQNGMRDPGKRYSPLKSRFQGLANAGYNERGNVEVAITHTAGAGSTYAALFELQYRDASPNPTSATTSVEARTQYARINDQNLSLLSSL